MASLLRILFCRMGWQSLDIQYHFQQPERIVRVCHAVAVEVSSFLRRFGKRLDAENALVNRNNVENVELPGIVQIAQRMICRVERQHRLALERSEDHRGRGQGGCGRRGSCLSVEGNSKNTDA